MLTTSMSESVWAPVESDVAGGRNALFQNFTHSRAKKLLGKIFIEPRLEFLQLAVGVIVHHPEKVSHHPKTHTWMTWKENIVSEA